MEDNGQTSVTEIDQKRSGQLLRALHKLQEQDGYLSENGLRTLSEQMQVPLSQVWAVATYYSGLRWQPQGEQAWKVCLGATCYAKGSGKILKRLVSELGVEPGEVSTDGSVSLDTVYCFGACSHAPVVLSEPESHKKPERSSSDVKLADRGQ